MRGYFAYRSLALTWAFMPFQVLFLESRGLSLGDVLDLNVVFTLATVALEVPTGVFADRYGRRRAMALGGLVMTAACALFVVGGSLWVYAAANALAALSMTLASGADSAWLHDYLAAQNLSDRYNHHEGLSTAAKGIGNLLAVLVGGVLYSVWPASVFVFTGALTAASAALALRLPESHATVRGTNAREHFLRAVSTLQRDPRLTSVMLFGALTFVLFRVSLFTDQPHLEIHLTGPWVGHLALAAALLAAAKEIGGAAIAFYSGPLQDRVATKILVPGLAVLAVGVYALMGRGNAALDIALMVILSSAFGLFSPLMRSVMNRLIIDSRDRATLLSFESMGRRLLFALASPLFGRAVEGSSLHATFTGTAWVAAVGYIALGVVAFGLFRIPVARDPEPGVRTSAVASLV